MSRLLLPGEAAAQLGVSLDTIRRYLENGLLDGITLPSGHRRVTAESVERVKNLGEVTA
jgi:excisionase family DNA binding protein